MIKHILKSGVIVIAISFVTPSFANTKTLHIGVRGDLNLLDPHTLNETFSIGILGNVLEGLTRRDRNLRIIPGLATSWRKLSPTHWRFRLRRGVRFHNGASFTADDVIFSMHRARMPASQMKVRIPADARFVKVDEYTVDVLLAKPDPILHYGWDNLYILSKSWTEAHGLAAPHPATARAHNLAALTTNGTGPFRIVSHHPGERTVFERNPDWWGGSGTNISRVVLHTVRSPSTRVSALLSRQLDVIAPAPLRELDRISRSGSTHITAGPELRTIFLNMDSTRDQLLYSDLKTANPFKDKRVRLAIYHAIDIETIRSKIMRGFSEPSALLISAALFSDAHKFARHPYDLVWARRLMADAGYVNGFGVTLDCPNNRYVNDEQICTAIVHMLAKINVRVQLRATPKARFFERVTATSGYDSSMSLLGWTPGSMDALEILTYLAACRDAAGTKGIFNLGGYCNREVDRLAALARTEVRPDQRNSLIAQAFRIIHNEAGLIPLHQQAIVWGVSNAASISIRKDNQIRFNLMRFNAKAATRD
jgi:peptide/nickel transport system substrate-binding protein